MLCVPSVCSDGSDICFLLVMIVLQTRVFLFHTLHNVSCQQQFTRKLVRISKWPKLRTRLCSCCRLYFGQRIWESDQMLKSAFLYFDFAYTSVSVRFCCRLTFPWYNSSTALTLVFFASHFTGQFSTFTVCVLVVLFYTEHIHTLYCICIIRTTCTICYMLNGW